MDLLQITKGNTGCIIQHICHICRPILTSLHHGLNSSAAFLTSLSTVYMSLKPYGMCIKSFIHLLLTDDMRLFNDAFHLVVCLSF